MSRALPSAAFAALLAVLAPWPGWTAPVTAPATPPTAYPVTPHRAVYDLSLAKTAEGGQVSQARGKLEFEWADACASWTISQRTHVRLIAAEGQVIEFGWSLNALEAKDGTAYRFFIRRLNAGQPPEDVKGTARLAGPGRGGTATFDTPLEKTIELPMATLFPTAHSLLLLEVAERGEASLGRVVFDGSGDEGIFFVNAVVSDAVPAGAEIGLDSALLRGQKSWRMSLAYFSLDETVAEPEHEQALRIYANGVVDDLILDYGDFALRATLESLEALPGAGC